MIVQTGSRNAAAARQDAPDARHAEMRDQHAGGQVPQQVLAAPVDALDPLPDEVSGEIDGNRPAQPPITDHDILDRTAFRVRRERPPRDFDFGQFRHARPRNRPCIVLLMCNVSSSPFATGRASPPWPP